MVKKTAVLVPAIGFAVLIGVLGLIFIPPEIKDKHIDFPRGTVRIDDSIITVEIADTAADRQRWLTFRDDTLPLDTAMLLVYDRPDLYSLWLLNIQYNLDLVWLDNEGNVVYIIENAKPCETALDPAKCTYKNTLHAKYIMASTAGFVDEHNITTQSKMTIISI